MWPFDRRARELATAKLEALEIRAEDALHRKDDDAVAECYTEARLLIGELNNARAFELLMRLDRYRDQRKQEREARLATASLDQLQPCRMCEGVEFHVSRPVWLEWSTRSTPRVRFAVCASCSHMTMWALDLDEVRRSEHFPDGLVTVKTGKTAPFR